MIAAAHPHIVALRTLRPSSVERLNNQHITVTAIDFISIQPIQTEELVTTLSETSAPLIFTSSHGVRATIHLLKNSSRKLNSFSVYCIEGVTANLLTNEGCTIKGSAPYSAELVERIRQNNEKEVLHCTSAWRRDEIELGLQPTDTKYIPLCVYEKDCTPKQITPPIDGVICFSPSQMDCYLQENSITPETPVFCIGHTTAHHVKSLRHTNIIIAADTSEEAIIQSVLNYYPYN
jgi:uroporphyrinogen-III synthase